MADPCTADNKNVKAFLRLIRFAEHYPIERDDWYGSLHGGGKFVG